MTRFMAIMRMATKQKVRDWVALSLSLLTAPLFVLFYWVLFSDSIRDYRVSILDNYANKANSCAAVQLSSCVESKNSTHIRNIQDVLTNQAKDHGGYTFSFTDAKNTKTAATILRKGDADLVVVFNTPLLARHGGSPSVATIQLMGDVSSSQYQFCAAVIEKNIARYVLQMHQLSPPVVFQQKALGVSAQKTTFEAYVPGLLVFAVIMLIFSSAMSVVKEIEAGTFTRIQMTPVGTFQLVGGLSLVQLSVGIVSVILTFIVASLLQFRSEGAIWVAMLIATIACAASVGIGMVVAAIAKTQSRAFLLSSIVMFLLVLFSGIIFPRPELTVFRISDYTVDLFDILPTTHLGDALNKVLTLGATMSDVLFQTGVLAAIAVLNFVIGSLLFIRSGKPATTNWEGML